MPVKLVANNTASTCGMGCLMVVVDGVVVVVVRSCETIYLMFCSDGRG